MARVYNGLTSESLDYMAMNAIPLKKDVIPNGNTFPKNLHWISMNGPDDPIAFDVVRLMYNQEENNSLTNETVVPGRYQRYFKWQDSSMLAARMVNGEDFRSQYEQDRREARNLNYDYIPQKAVFAPDLIYKDIPYPIRSGYYFNPAGRYEFTIETTIYKDSNDRTQEHEDLVNAMIRAFRYESDMVYIDPLSEAAVSINGTYVEKMGTTYGPVTNKSANNIGINDYTEFLGTDFFDVFIKPDPINVVEVHHSGYPSYIVGSGYDAIALEQSAHESFRRNMEGYTGSGTSENRYTYKYAEFVERNVKIYEVKEKTTVTITINPDNNRVYTHPQMKNGQYYIRAYIGEVDLYAPTYGQLSNINKDGGRFTLDDLEIDVIGSRTDVSVSGRIKSYNPDKSIFIQLYKQYSDDVYTTTIDSDTGSGQAEQEFRFAGVAPGIYDLVIAKDVHTKFTVKDVAVGNEDLDFTLDKRPEVQLMTLRCGDINGDGLINDADLTILWRAGNYNKKAVEAENSRCDLNGDGLINDADLTILWLAYNYNRGAIIID